ncbi:cytochrome c/c1 heme-lyase [Paraphysoderma sedebokerense]|nr:cytochrome c/c1 heme-lyase [Paraphysoderma sedebokerense]
MSSIPRSGCPVQHSNSAPVQPPSNSEAPHSHDSQPSISKCPVQHDSMPSSSESKDINPLNMMPTLSQSPAPGQKSKLSTERAPSSIPRGGEETPSDPVWVYPSPQQFYNALKRKGWETPEQEIDIMVDIHNELNENCWREILKWEEMHRNECERPKLLKLRGRPNELSPKARIHGWVYGTPRPFDRHDWVIDRCGKEVRYIIDYYSAPDEGDTPVFYVDVRPALDSPTSVMDRVKVGLNEIWERWQSS